MLSKQKIINQHIAFMQSHNFDVGQDQINRWSATPAGQLQKILAQDRLEIRRGWSSYAANSCYNPAEKSNT